MCILEWALNGGDQWSSRSSANSSMFMHTLRQEIVFELSFTIPGFHGCAQITVILRNEKEISISRLRKCTVHVLRPPWPQSRFAEDLVLWPSLNSFEFWCSNESLPCEQFVGILRCSFHF